MMLTSTISSPRVGLVADISPLPRGECDVGGPNLGRRIITKKAWTAWQVHAFFQFVFQNE